MTQPELILWSIIGRRPLCASVCVRLCVWHISVCVCVSGVCHWQVYLDLSLSPSVLLWLLAVHLSVCLSVCEFRSIINIQYTAPHTMPCCLHIIGLQRIIGHHSLYPPDCFLSLCYTACLYVCMSVSVSTAIRSSGQTDRQTDRQTHTDRHSYRAMQLTRDLIWASTVICFISCSDIEWV